MKMRMVNILKIALVVFGIAAGYSAAAETVVRTKLYFCCKTDAPPKIDGNLDDACWKQALPIADFGFLRFGDQKGPAPKTTVKALYDDAYLYLAFDCEEPDMAKFNQIINQTAAVYARDCIECYIDTKNDDKGYFDFMMNVKNESYAEARIDMGYALVADNSFNLWVRWERKGALREKGWSLEVKINWQDLKVVPEAGTIMGFNPCRWRFTADPNQYLCWSTIGGYQKIPADFGHMVLGSPSDKIETVLKKIYPEYRRLTIEMPIANGFKIFKDGQVAFAAYRQILAGHLDNLEKQLQGVAALPEFGKLPDKKIPEKLSGLKEKLSGLRKSVLESSEITEGGCLEFLKSIDQSRNETSDIEWQVKRDALLGRFAQQLGT